MGLHSDRSLGKHCALPRKIFRAGQAVNFCLFVLTVQRYSIFVPSPNFSQFCPTKHRFRVEKRAEIKIAPHLDTENTEYSFLSEH
jgi:hypothetical protein